MIQSSIASLQASFLKPHCYKLHLDAITQSASMDWNLLGHQDGHVQGEMGQMLRQEAGWARGSRAGSRRSPGLRALCQMPPPPSPAPGIFSAPA